MCELAVLAKTESNLERLFDGEEVVELLIDRAAVYATDRRPRKSLTRSHDSMISNRFVTAETIRSARDLRE